MAGFESRKAETLLVATLQATYMLRPTFKFLKLVFSYFTASRSEINDRLTYHWFLTCVSKEL